MPDTVKRNWTESTATLAPRPAFVSWPIKKPGSMRSMSGRESHAPLAKVAGFSENGIKGLESGSGESRVSEESDSEATLRFSNINNIS